MKALIFAVVLILSSINTFSQWQPDQRLTNYPGNSYISANGQRCIAADGLNVHVVWYDAFIGNYQIFYKRTTDGGITWGQDTMLNLTNYEAVAPSIAVSGNDIHLTWMDRRIGNPEIYYKKSSNGGISWGPDTRLTDNVYNSEHAVVDADGSTVMAVWKDDRDGNAELYYKRSTDAGTTWSSDTRLTNFAGPSSEPTIKIAGTNIHVAWDDGRNGANTEIYYKRSTDLGITWGNDIRLTNYADLSLNPSLAVSGQEVHVVWEDFRDGNAEIYYKNSTDNGSAWNSDKRLTNNASNSWHPSVGVSGSHVHVAWGDNRDGNHEIYYNVSSNSGANWGTDTRLTNAADNSYNACIAVSGSAIHVVWHDYRDGNFEIYYKQNPTGNTISVETIGTQIPAAYMLYQNYPNPFNPVTNIKFSIPVSGNVRLIVYDMLGKEIKTLVNENLNAGIYSVDWDASQFSSGVYFYRIEAGTFSGTGKMILIK
jgi:hypothetical protein